MYKNFVLDTSSLKLDSVAFNEVYIYQQICTLCPDDNDDVVLCFDIYYSSIARQHYVPTLLHNLATIRLSTVSWYAISKNLLVFACRSMSR